MNKKPITIRNIIISNENICPACGGKDIARPMRMPFDMLICRKCGCAFVTHYEDVFWGNEDE